MKAAQQRWRSKGGYSLIEVGIAMMVLSLTVASSIMAMRIGFSMIESARDNTLASQILQSEMENLRLRDWERLSALPDGVFEMEEGFQATAAGRFVCTREVEQPKAFLCKITLQVVWKTSNGQTVTRRYSSFFSKSGLNDYYYRAFY